MSVLGHTTNAWRASPRERRMSNARRWALVLPVPGSLMSKTLLHCDESTAVSSWCGHGVSIGLRTGHHIDEFVRERLLHLVEERFQFVRLDELVFDVLDERASVLEEIPYAA